MTGDAVGSLRRSFAVRQMSQGTMNIIASVPHLSCVIGPGLALGLQHEINHVGDAGNLGLFRVQLSAPPGNVQRDFPLSPVPAASQLRVLI